MEAPKVNQRNIISLIQTPGCNGADECLRRVPLVHPPIAKRATPIRWRGNIYLDNLTGCTGRNHCLRLIGLILLRDEFTGGGLRRGGGGGGDRRIGSRRKK